MADDTITINRQDKFSKILKTLDGNGNLVDATGWTIYFTVRTVVASTSTADDTDAVISKEIAGEASGIHTLTLSPTDTDIDPATYLYDFQIKKSATDIISTVAADFIISGDITRST